MAFFKQESKRDTLLHYILAMTRSLAMKKMSRFFSCCSTVHIRLCRRPLTPSAVTYAVDSDMILSC